MAFHLVQLANQMLTMVRQRVSRDLASSVPCLQTRG